MANTVVRRTIRRSLAALVTTLVVALAVACSGGGGPSKRRLSIATGTTGGVYYPYGGGIAKIISEYLPNTEATAEVTAASIDNLKFIRDGKSDLAFTLTDTLAEAVKGVGPFADGAVPARSLAVLYVSYTHLVTLAANGIDSVKGLKGHAVSTGTPGGGGEPIAFRVLEAAGVNRDTDIRRQGLSPAQAADAMKDGKLDAFFWTGGLPTAAVLDLSHTPGITIRLLPSDAYVDPLNAKYGAGLYSRAIIPKGTYPGMNEDVAVVGLGNALVVNASMPEQVAYDITRLLFEKQKELEAIHPEAANLKIETAPLGSPAPLHPGAERYYREHGVIR